MSTQGGDGQCAWGSVLGACLLCISDLCSSDLLAGCQAAWNYLCCSRAKHSLSSLLVCRSLWSIYDNCRKHCLLVCFVFGYEISKCLFPHTHIPCTVQSSCAVCLYLHFYYLSAVVEAGFSNSFALALYISLEDDILLACALCAKGLSQLLVLIWPLQPSSYMLTCLEHSSVFLWSHFLRLGG